MNKKAITLNHGSGGKASQDLIRNVFINSFGNSSAVLSDSAILKISGQSLAFTTDSFVIDPIFFPGGDIGKLAVCGTVNDLAVSGAIPKYISVSFIIEEGFDMKDLEKIAESIAMQAKIANVKIVTGDTKVVNKGKCDKLFINTSGIGVFEKGLDYISTGEQVEQGDLIIINGTLGDHSVAVLGARNNLGFKTDIVSDCACLNDLIQELICRGIRIKFMRDITRGGLATILNELSEITNLGIEINEKEIPIKDSVKGICEVLGFDSLYLANEGKVMLVIHPDDAEKTLEIMRQNSLGVDSKIIGEIVNMHLKMVVGKTGIGGTRIINMLQGEQLPRIC
ncbi:MAG: hydrogenase expression/formation protein HypE [Bacteroidetes bacterium GWF2_33_16]|nr:MAG: hydrogenase expression/formation protein HypE [Bacteroidetes bacterium GWE2_32_14]OFY06742.1 MAG: hydrogenase expression/formation protein HypE [Bacteroidetes bacterium GWF2_33_16]